jgi:hypothetical protein
MRPVSWRVSVPMMCAGLQPLETVNHFSVAANVHGIRSTLRSSAPPTQTGKRLCPATRSLMRGATVRPQCHVNLLIVVLSFAGDFR